MTRCDRCRGYFTFYQGLDKIDAQHHSYTTSEPIAEQHFILLHTIRTGFRTLCGKLSSVRFLVLLFELSITRFVMYVLSSTVNTNHFPATKKTRQLIKQHMLWAIRARTKRSIPQWVVVEDDECDCTILHPPPDEYECLGILSMKIGEKSASGFRLYGQTKYSHGQALRHSCSVWYNLE